jgi:hypothetical protein
MFAGDRCTALLSATAMVISEDAESEPGSEAESEPDGHDGAA